MKAYVLVTGVIFGLITLAHFLRMFFEPHVAQEPVFLALTALTIGLCVWSVILLSVKRK